MKSYEEVTRDLLKRRNEYEEAQARRQRTVLRAAVPVCSVALVAAMGVGVWKSGVLEKPPVTSNSSNVGGQLVSPDDPHANDKIVINKLETVGMGSLDIGLVPEDFIEMTYDEMLEYYGAEIIPDIPENLTLEEYEDRRYGIYKRDGGTGEVYYDNTRFDYFDQDGIRNVSIEAAKGRLPFSCVVFADDCKEKSYIRGVEILMVKIGKEGYSAELMVRGVGFRIKSGGLSEEEFVDVVASIIEKNK